MSLQISDGEEILATHNRNGGKFGIEKMSDGERGAATIETEVVVADPGVVFLIDEPDRHLYRPIIEPFLSYCSAVGKTAASWSRHMKSIYLWHIQTAMF